GVIGGPLCRPRLHRSRPPLTTPRSGFVQPNIPPCACHPLEIAQPSARSFLVLPKERRATCGRSGLLQNAVSHLANPITFPRRRQSFLHAYVKLSKLQSIRNYL